MGFSQAEEEFKKRMDLMESSMNERFSLSKFFDMDQSDWMNAKLPEFSKLNLVDEHELKIVDVEDKLEISLDTTGYKPDELKVTAGEGVVMIEVRAGSGDGLQTHEEVISSPSLSSASPGGQQPLQGWCPRHHCPKDQDNQTTNHGCPNQRQIKLLIRITQLSIYC